MLRNCKKIVRKLARRLIAHPSLDLALHITVPEGHGLGEVRQLVGSNEDAREKIDEGQRRGKGKCSRRDLPSPLARCARERTQVN